MRNPHELRANIGICISVHRDDNVLVIVKGKPWVSTIQRLLKAEMRSDPRAKSGTQARLKYWNGQDLSAASGIRPNTVSDAMTGKRDPSLETLTAIATALGVHPAVLLMDPDEADAFLKFKQSQSASAEDARLTTKVHELAQPLLDKFEQMILSQLSAPSDSRSKENTPEQNPARGRLQRSHKKKRSA